MSESTNAAASILGAVPVIGPFLDFGLSIIGAIGDYATLQKKKDEAIADLQAQKKLYDPNNDTLLSNGSFESTYKEAETAGSKKATWINTLADLNSLQAKSLGVAQLQETALQNQWAGAQALTQAEQASGGATAAAAASGVRREGTPLMALVQAHNDSFAAAREQIRRGESAIDIGRLELERKLLGITTQRTVDLEQNDFATETAKAAALRQFNEINRLLGLMDQFVGPATPGDPQAPESGPTGETSGTTATVTPTTQQPTTTVLSDGRTIDEGGNTVLTSGTNAGSTTSDLTTALQGAGGSTTTAGVATAGAGGGNVDVLGTLAAIGAFTPGAVNAPIPTTTLPNGETVDQGGNTVLTTTPETGLTTALQGDGGTETTAGVARAGAGGGNVDVLGTLAAIGAFTPETEASRDTEARGDSAIALESGLAAAAPELGSGGVNASDTGADVGGRSVAERTSFGTIDTTGIVGTEETRVARGGVASPVAGNDIAVRPTPATVAAIREADTRISESYPNTLPYQNDPIDLTRSAGALAASPTSTATGGNATALELGSSTGATEGPTAVEAPTDTPTAVSDAWTEVFLSTVQDMAW